VYNIIIMSFRRTEVLSIRWKNELDRLEFQAVAIDKGMTVSELARTAIFGRIEKHFAESPDGREAIMDRYMAARERMAQEEGERLIAEIAETQALIDGSL